MDGEQAALSELVGLRVRVEVLEQDLSEAVHLIYCWSVLGGDVSRIRIQTEDPWTVEGQVPPNAARILPGANPNRSGQTVRLPA